MLLVEIPFSKGKRVRVKEKGGFFFKTNYPHAGKYGTVVGFDGLNLHVKFDNGQTDSVGYDTLALI